MPRAYRRLDGHTYDTMAGGAAGYSSALRNAAPIDPTKEKRANRAAVMMTVGRNRTGPGGAYTCAGVSISNGTEGWNETAWYT